MMCTKNLVCGYIFKLLSLFNIKISTQDYKHEHLHCIYIYSLLTCVHFILIPLIWKLLIVIFLPGHCLEFSIFCVDKRIERKCFVWQLSPHSPGNLSCRVHRFPFPVNFNRPGSYFINFIRVITVLRYFTAFFEF